MKKRNSSAGFTLIELLVAVAVIAILAAVALPNYNDYVRRAALSAAFADLSDMRIKMEQFYQNNRGYGASGEAIPCGHDGAANRVSFTGSGNNFTYACALTGPVGKVNQGFTITATGNIGAAGDHVYTLDSNNLKKTTAFKAGTVDKTCWLSKGSEC